MPLVVGRGVLDSVSSLNHFSDHGEMIERTGKALHLESEVYFPALHSWFGFRNLSQALGFAEIPVPCVWSGEKNPCPVSPSVSNRAWGVEEVRRGVQVAGGSFWGALLWAWSCCYWSCEWCLALLGGLSHQGPALGHTVDHVTSACFPAGLAPGAHVGPGIFFSS